ncbi:MAG: DUF3611 family protein, partial [Microcystaceae cyanobacterium]
MRENYEITPSRSSLPPAVQRVSSNLKRAGNIGFWLQIILGVVSTVTLLFASTSLVGNQQRTSGSEVGIFCAFCGIIMLIVGIFFCFRYRRIARLLQNSDSALRPKKADTYKVIRLGLIVNLVGMLLAILGAAALVGLVLAKSLTIPQGAIGYNDPRKFVNSIDLLIIQANTNTITAHFAGIVTSLWLLD